MRDEARKRGGRERETEKVIKEIMDGSLRELQRTNSHFQFASGQRERGRLRRRRRSEGVKAKPFYRRLDPCRPSVRFRYRILSAAEEFHFKSFPFKLSTYLSTSRGELRLYLKGTDKTARRDARVVLINT